jgi:hypothetical protein
MAIERALRLGAALPVGTRRARVLWLRGAAGLVGFTVLLVDGLAGGGYFPRTWRLTTFAFCALAAAALVGRRRIALSRLERVFLGLVAGLAAWTALSKIWSDTPQTSVLEGERALVYVAGVGLALVALERAAVPTLLGGALAGVTAASAYGLGTYVIFGHELNPIEGNLLFEPLGYANGLGIYAAIGILLAVGLALALETRRLRLACAACLGVLGPTLYLTHSRAAELGVVVGLAAAGAPGRDQARHQQRQRPRDRVRLHDDDQRRHRERRQLVPGRGIARHDQGSDAGQLQRHRDGSGRLLRDFHRLYGHDRAR